MSTTSEVVAQPIVIHGPITSGALLTEIPTPAGSAEPATMRLAEAVPDQSSVRQEVSPSEGPASAAVPRERAEGLDAFRGLMLIAMNFAFTIPFGPFPGWMHHVQYPPPDGAFVELAGLSWRDMLYAGFMFTMSAALPITHSARLSKRMPYPEIIWIALRRMFLLYIFAMVIGHVNPYWTHQYNKLGNVMSVFGFVLLFTLFVRPRSDWNPVRVQWLRYAGWLGVLALFFLSPAIYGESFSAERADEVIKSIGWATVAGTVIWLFTRKNIIARFAILGVILALRTAAQHSEWAASLWYWTPARWLYDPWFAEMLFIVIPGTIAGDLLVQWMSRNEASETGAKWSDKKLIALALLGISYVPISLVGLWERQAVPQTTAAIALLGAASIWLTRNPIVQRDRVLARLFAWSAFWLIVGMLTEPFEGGIKKVPLTISYLTLMTGISCALLASLLVAFDHFAAFRRRFKAIIDIGQNPLIAYVVLNLFLMHILWYTGIAGRFRESWPEALARSAVITAAGVFLVWLASRKRLYWRA